MSDKFQVKFTEWAELDLEYIIAYIAENDDIQKAIKIFSKIKEKVFSLSKFPKRGRVVPELNRINIKDYIEIIYKSYRIIYFIENKTVFIVGILDGRRDLESTLYQRIFSA
jgi:toxin ParE1/3/4